MQTEIIKFLEKNRKKLPDWITQTELKNMLMKTFKVSCQANICGALKKMRKWNEIKFLEIRNINDFKKINRTDLMINIKHVTFAYKIR